MRCTAFDCILSGLCGCDRDWGGISATVAIIVLHIPKSIIGLSVLKSPEKPSKDFIAVIDFTMAEMSRC